MSAFRSVSRAADKNGISQVAIPGFPNLFTMLGNNVAPTHGSSFIVQWRGKAEVGLASVLFQLEVQANYIAEAVDKMRRRDVSVLEVREDAAKLYNECGRIAFLVVSDTMSAQMAR